MSIKITVSDGTSFSIPYAPYENAQLVMEAAYLYAEANNVNFSFAVQYYGYNKQGTYLGYMVVMVNGVYDNPNSDTYWEVNLNGTPAPVGIDTLTVADGDTLGFVNTSYTPPKHKGTLLEIKKEHAAKHRQSH